MIFCGDISLPFDNAVRFKNIPSELLNKNWVCNLEGSLVKEQSDVLLNRYIVFNDFNAVKSFTKKFNVNIFNIANNHILDAANLNTTLSNISLLGIKYVGAGLNLEESQKEIVLENFVIISFGWNAINCIYAKKNKEGVNPYTKENVLRCVHKLKIKYPDKKIITLFHWNYELELYPQPFDRFLAHRMIDYGVYAVIGCHAHRVQPIEIYKGKPIVYGMGNFAFRQSIYMQGKLKFPDFTCEEVAFEITVNGDFVLHKFKYDKIKHVLSYTGIEKIINCNFSQVNDKQYKHFFKRNRYHKKALPIFNYEDSTFILKSKLYWIIMRNKITLFLSHNTGLFNLIKKTLSKIYD